MTAIVYLNGRFLPRKKAQVSVFDRGFLFGDSAYEVVPIYTGKPFRLSAHLLRLQRSLKALNIGRDVAWKRLKQDLLTLLVKNNVTRKEYSLYIQITRGTNFARSFYLPVDLKPTIFAALQSIKVPNYQELSLGKIAITLPDIRWQYSYIKSTSLLPSVLLYNLVRKADCDEGILIRNGYVSEGISSNVFVVHRNKVLIPPLAKVNLAGITRGVVLQLLQKNEIPYVIQDIPARKLLAADEIWITSSTRGIFPIIKLNNKLVGDGSPGIMWQRVVKLYFAYRKKIIARA